MIQLEMYLFFHSEVKKTKCFNNDLTFFFFKPKVWNDSKTNSTFNWIL